MAPDARAVAALWVVVAAAPGFEVVGAASSGREALFPDRDRIETALRIRRHRPDVVVLLPPGH
jgi:hypothetical protein